MKVARMILCRCVKNKNSTHTTLINAGFTMMTLDVVELIVARSLMMRHRLRDEVIRNRVFAGLDEDS